MFQHRSLSELRGTKNSWVLDRTIWDGALFQTFSKHPFANWNFLTVGITVVKSMLAWFVPTITSQMQLFMIPSM